MDADVVVTLVHKALVPLVGMLGDLRLWVVTRRLQGVSLIVVSLTGDGVYE